MSKVKSIVKYNTNVKLIHRIHSDGYEDWCEFDAKGNCIHYRTSGGFEQWWEYDANDNCIHHWDSNEHEAWYYKGKITKEPIEILILKAKLREKTAKIS